MTEGAEPRPEPGTRPLIEDDRRDLLALLRMRYGEVPPEIMASVAAIDDGSRIDHLILVAANAAAWSEFATEVRQPGFRIVGQGFDPLHRPSPAATGRGEPGGK